MPGSQFRVHAACLQCAGCQRGFEMTSQCFMRAGASEVLRRCCIQADTSQVFCLDCKTRSRRDSLAEVPVLLYTLVRFLTVGIVAPNAAA